MTPRALVTGSTGFIGSHLVESLLARNWDVTCLIRPKSRTDNLSGLPVQRVRGDIDDIPSLEAAIHGQDFIFHAAGRIRSAPKDIYDRANHRFTKNLAHACLANNPDIKRFVYISSVAASGPSLPGQRKNETQACAPTSEYGRSKLRGEQALYAVWDRLPVTIIRPPSVYGPQQLETELLLKTIRRRIVPLLKEKGEATTLIYIKDLINGIILAALSQKTSGQIYYLTDGQNYSWRHIILTAKDQVLGKSFSLPIPENLILFFAWISDLLNTTGLANIHFGRKIWRAMVQTPWVFSSAKAEMDFGFKPKYSLQAGLKETVQYDQ